MQRSHSPHHLNRLSDEKLSQRDIGYIQFALIFLAGFALPYLGTFGKIIGGGVLAVTALSLLTGILSRRKNIPSHLFGIGFLCGGEIFFRDFALKENFGYLGVEYILIIVGLLSFLSFSGNISAYSKKHLLVFWFMYCAWTFSSLTYSMDPVAGRWFLSIYLAGLSLFLIIASIPNDDMATEALIKGVAAGAILVCGTGLQFYLTSSVSFLSRTSYRFAHALSSPNQIAITLAAGAFGLVYLFLFKNKKIYLLPILILTTFLIATFSRGVVISFLLAIFILLLFTPGVKKLQLILLMFLLTPTTYYLYTQLADVFASRYQNIKLDSERRGIYTVSYYAWQERPILGYGIGSWSKIYPTFADLDSDAPSYISDAHNVFLQTLVETGSIGGFFFAIFILSLFIQSLRSKSPLALASVSMVFIIGMAENWKLSVFYILLGLALAFINKKPEEISITTARR